MQNNNLQLTWESRRKNVYGKTRSAFSFTHSYSLASIIIKKKNLLQKYDAELTPNPRVKKSYCFYVNKPQWLVPPTEVKITNAQQQMANGYKFHTVTLTDGSLDVKR
jgi:hypothetical protein